MNYFREFMVWLFRSVSVAALAIIVRTSLDNRDGVNDIKHDIKDVPKIQKDVEELKRQGAAYPEIFATKKELTDTISAAEMRVRNDFTKTLNEQLKKKKLITNPGNHDYDN